ncbi:MAG TPA: hypothetical protein VI076_08595 [Actinopolymorphaceae bacterium]
MDHWTDDTDDLADRLTNQSKAISALEGMVTLTHSIQDGLLKELRATQIRHGEILREQSALLRALVGRNPGCGFGSEDHHDMREITQG